MGVTLAYGHTVQAIKFGADNYLPKPAIIDAILVALQEADQIEPAVPALESSVMSVVRLE